MTADRQVPDSVLDNVVTSRHTLPGRIGRRVVLGLLTVFIVLAVLQVFDSETSGSASTGQFTLTVDYPATARPGMSGTVAVHIHSETPISVPLSISIPENYLDNFSVEDISPAAGSEGYVEGYRQLRFDAPQGRDFTLKLRGSWATDAAWAVSGSVRAAVEGGAAASVNLKTWMVF